ncbi:hypothetical protein F5Y15DRAFT_141274 [Xylariaceae sp. FL0016]|nr:hypothetical protein F5Y15DRAFT_141274 [Xylariaceae sp. FL0016]
MGIKRDYSEFQNNMARHGSSEASNANRQEPQSRERIPGFHPAKRSRQTKGHKTKVNPKSLQWVKKRIRTIERRFKTGQNLPANVQNDLEQELAYHKQNLDERADEKKRSSMIKKYHMVRFHERKKADRLAKQIQSQLEKATDPTEIERLKADLHIAKVDSLYSRYFPHRERYVGLYSGASLGLGVQSGTAPEDAGSASRALHSERPPMWKTIEKAAEKGTSALTEIRERKLAKTRKKRESSQGTNAGASGQQKEKGATSSSHAGSNKGRSKSKEEASDSGSSSDDDSDGGFFE